MTNMTVWLANLLSQAVITVLDGAQTCVIRQYQYLGWMASNQYLDTQLTIIIDSIKKFTNLYFVVPPLSGASVGCHNMRWHIGPGSVAAS